MDYVGNAYPSSDCVFCQASAADDDVSNLVLHRGQQCFVVMNLYPYNTGHLMVVPYEHVDDLASLAPEARSEMAELSASFCTGLKQVMGCDGLNLGMNLGSVAGAGISDHLHQHIVPRWKGDANFMPIVGGTKVLPELIPATYGKLRAEVARKQRGHESIKTVLVDPDWSSIYLVDHRLPDIALDENLPCWKSVTQYLAPYASTLSLLGWAGAGSTRDDEHATSALAYQITPLPQTGRLQRHSLPGIADDLPGDEGDLVRAAIGRFAPPAR
jgi:ATP adenylyltransferase